MNEPDGATARPLLSNRVFFREDDAHLEALARVNAALFGGRLTSDLASRLAFRIGVSVLEALQEESHLTVPAPSSVPTDQMELWNEFVTQAISGGGRRGLY
ncbi:MAG TPA: hypothetical protein VHY22_02590 [Chthoniobacteraceae bacterium]|jgi:hypothetical protein|nr:hypothetical protein [Chthoniobacteraceae bacterium]